MIEGIKEIFKRAKIIDGPPLRILVNIDEFIGVISYVRERGFNQLTLYTAIDWIKEGNFELIAILYNNDTKDEVYVKTYIPRANPRIESIKDLYPQAATYEKEMHEFFGIEFIGNDDMGPFILENWRFEPPLRKDFDTAKFAKEFYHIPDDIQDEEMEYKNRQIKYRGFRYNERG